MGCRLWGRTELDMAEATYQQQHSDMYSLFFIKELTLKQIMGFPKCVNVVIIFLFILLSYLNIIKVSWLKTQHLKN